MRTATEKTLARHLDAITSGIVDRTNVIGLRKTINLAERRFSGWSVPKHAPDLDQIAPLEHALEKHEPRVMGELHDTGKRLLQNPRYRKTWQDWQADIIADIDYFRLVRFDRIGRRGEYGVPVYRVVSKHGNFLFRCIPWQSGGNGPEPVGEQK